MAPSSNQAPGRQLKLTLALTLAATQAVGTIFNTVLSRQRSVYALVSHGAAVCFGHALVLAWISHWLGTAFEERTASQRLVGEDMRTPEEGVSCVSRASHHEMMNAIETCSTTGSDVDELQAASGAHSTTKEG